MSKGFNKTRKSVAKRFKVTGTGKLKVKKLQGRSHLMSSKNAKKKRHLKRRPILRKTTADTMKTMLGI